MRFTSVFFWGGGGDFFFFEKFYSEPMRLHIDFYLFIFTYISFSFDIYIWQLKIPCVGIPILNVI